MPPKTADTTELEAAIAAVSKKKSKVLTPEALAAKAQYDQHKHDLELNRTVDNDDWDEIADFNANIRIVMALFQQSKFDELTMLLARPMRLFTLQLLMGFVRGMGFALGVLMIAMLTVATTISFLAPELIEKIARYLH